MEVQEVRNWDGWVRGQVIRLGSGEPSSVSGSRGLAGTPAYAATAMYWWLCSESVSPGFMGRTTSPSSDTLSLSGTGLISATSC